MSKVEDVPETAVECMWEHAITIEYYRILIYINIIEYYFIEYFRILESWNVLLPANLRAGLFAGLSRGFRGCAFGFRLWNLTEARARKKPNG
jgi:hypothetical protein